METAVAEETSIEVLENPNDYFYKIAVIIEEFDNQPFTLKDLRKKLQKEGCQVPYYNFPAFVKKRVEKGRLRKIKKGVYQKIDGAVLFDETRLPNRLLSDYIWRVLSETNEPLSATEITVKTEEFFQLNKNPLFSSKNILVGVSVVLNRLFKKGAVIRRGMRGEYTYLKNPELTERPSSTG